MGTGTRTLVGLILVVATLGCASLRAGRLYLEGTAALDRGESALAVARLEEAVRLRPQASEIHNHLGLAYAGEGRHGDAYQAWERAVALDCDNQPALRNLEAARLRAEDPAP